MQRSRIRPLVGMLVLAFLLIAARLVQLQGLHWRDYRVEAESTRRHIRYLPAPRGSLLDRDGRALAQDVPSHDIVFTLLELERASAVVREVARGLRVPDLPADPRTSTEHLAFLLQQLRNRVRPGLLGEAARRPVVWLDGIAAARGRSLTARIERHPERFPGVMVQETGATSDSGRSETSRSGTATLRVVPAELFAGEAAVHALARRLGEEDPVELHARRVWLPLLRAREQRNRTARQWTLEEERVLFRDVPFELVLELCYHPERYPGLGVRAGRARSYPAPRSLAQLIGYLGRPTERDLRSWREDERLLSRSTGINDIRTFLALRPVSHFESALVGRSGLERSLEDRLRGQPGARILEVDRHGRERGDPLDEAEVVPGADLRLTLDRELCAELELLLLRDFTVAGSALVGDPSTGEILGWCSLPSFDSENFSDWSQALADPRGPLRDRPQWALPPGSTFKMVAAVGALQEGLLSADETITCTGYYDPRRRDHLRCRNHSLVISDIEVSEALARSCNTFFYDLGGRRLGVEGLERWAREFGFGAATGLEIPERTVDLGLRHAESAAIGKGRMLATPLQLLRYVSGIANRGLLPELRLLRDTRSRLRHRRLPVAPWVWDEIIAGMQGAVRYGTVAEPSIGLHEFDCAVKSGTADVGASDIAWVIGFAPVADPRVAFVICLEDQQRHGGEAAGPIAAGLLEWLTEHRGWPLRAPEDGR